MLENEFNQTGGDNSQQYQAEELTVNNYNIEQANYEIRSNALKRLIDAYNIEVVSAREGSQGEFIEKLSLYINKLEGDYQDLGEKLNSAGYGDSVELALRLKQYYFKQLQKIKHIKAAQKIHAYILARVLMDFHTNVYEHLKNKASKQFIHALIKTQIILPLDELINSVENVLEINYDDIYGMIYYLTGNCHIKWE